MCLCHHAQLPRRGTAFLFMSFLTFKIKACAALGSRGSTSAEDGLRRSSASARLNVGERVRAQPGATTSVPARAGMFCGHGKQRPAEKEDASHHEGQPDAHCMSKPASGCRAKTVPFQCLLTARAAGASWWPSSMPMMFSKRYSLFQTASCKVRRRQTASCKLRRRHLRAAPASIREVSGASSSYSKDLLTRCLVNDAFCSSGRS